MPSFLLAIPGALKLVPRWIWYALAAALVWHFALSWHHGKVRSHDRDVIAARDAQWQKRFDQERAKATADRQRFDAERAQLSQALKDKHDAEVRHNADDARDLSLRGAGKATAPASCRPSDNPGTPALSGGQGQATAQADAARPQVPSGDWALVPWQWLVTKGQEHDDLLSEVRTTRDADTQQRAAWEKMRAQP